MPESDQSTASTPSPAPPPVRRGIPLGLGLAILLIMTAFAFVLGTRAESFGWLNYNDNQLNLTSVQQTYQTLKDKYNGHLNVEALIEGANRGLVEAVGDPYTVYFSESEAGEFLAELEGQFDGIGAEIGKTDGNLVIVATLDGSPAKASDLRAGDVILKVNDEDATKWSIEEAVSKIRGPKGTTVKLEVLREGEIKEISITRDTITSPSVVSEVKDNIGIMRISRFGETDTADLAKKAAEDFKNRQVKGVVLDLRGNGGGYLDAAVQVASLWLDKDQTVVTERRGDKVIDDFKSSKEPILKGIPTIVLIDGGSASASEILAGALSDAKVAKLLGQKTFGKGSVQQIEQLSGGAQLKVTIAEWFTPSGRNINKEGIAPDIEVDAGENPTPENDPQLQAAIAELLR